MDLELLYILQQARVALGTGFEQVMAFLSDLSISSAISVVFAGLYWCLDKELGQRALMNMAGGTLLNQTLKNTFTVYRPWIRDSRLYPSPLAVEGATGYSFPSGHSTLVTAQFGTIGMDRKRGTWLRVLSFVYVAVILFTRMFLGCHTPQDVLVGCGLCFVCIIFNDKLLVWTDGGKNRDLLLLAIGAALTGAFLLYACLRPYPMDTTQDGSLLVDPAEMLHDCFGAAGLMLGFLLGWVLERRRVGFSCQGRPAQLLVRFVMGGIGMLLLSKFGKACLIPYLGQDIGKMLYHSVVFFFAMGLYPLLFTRAETALYARAKG